MLPDVVSVTFDHAQTRVQRHPVAAQAWGLGWNGRFSSNTWIDPVTDTLMMRPMALYEAFFTSNSGIYTKPAKIAYEFTTSGNWSEVEQFVGAGPYLRTDVAGEYARTASAPGKNRPVFVSWYGYGAGDSSAIVVSIGWDNTSTTTTGSEIGLDVFSTGEVNVYKDGSLVGSGRITVKTNEFNHVLLIPMRKRELLVVSTDGAGFVVVFDDIAETATTPEITPNEKVWLKANSAATSAMIQICPCRFESSGYATSEVVTFTRIPQTGDTLRTWSNPVFSGITSANLYGDKSYSGTDDVSAVALRLTDDSAAFVPDSSENQCRIKITLSSDGNYTSFVFGAYLEYPGATDTCDDSEESSPNSYLTALRMDIPDDAWGNRLFLEFREPDTLASTVPKLREVSNRPVKLEVDTLVLWDGRTLPTRFVMDLQDLAQRAAIECKDMTAALEAFTFRDTYVLDGYELSLPTGSGYSAVRHILGVAGLTTSQMDLSDANFLIPSVPGAKSSEFSFAIEVGETGSRALERIHQEFAASWFMGLRPTATGMKFCFLAPADLPSTPAITLYPSIDDALTALGDRHQVFITYEDQPEEVDANEVWATGYDHRKRQVVQAVAIDDASVDCTVAPSLRPDNWLGEPKMFGVIDPRLRTEDDCERTVDLLVPVVTARRILGEIETAGMIWYDSGGGVMLPLWRGDLVELDGIGEVRVTSMSVEIIRNTSGALASQARYTFGGFTHAGGTSLAQIQARNAERRTNSKLSLPQVFSQFGTQFVATRRRGP